ncbi:hypothetical protein GC175_26425 [bacterium]|nr:hypothetical protein [bacterium]
MISQWRQTNQRQVQPWQQCILASYALFFAFVLPFFCWGSAGTPGHPHEHAHFIFTSPEATKDTHTHVHFPEFINGEWVFVAHDHPEDGGSLPVRSDPDLSLITILLLLLSATATVAYTPLSLFSRRLAQHPTHSLIHTPPAPPPRPLLSLR